MAYNLNGSVLRITTRYDNRYNYDVEVEDLGKSGDGTQNFSLKGGFAIVLVFELSRFLNFSYKLVPSVGAYDFGNATAHQIDLFAGSYILTEARAQIVDFTLVTAKSKVSAFMNHDFESSTGDIVRAPFQQNLWFGIITLVILISISAIILAWAEKSNSGSSVWWDLQFQCLAVITSRDSRLKSQILKERTRFFLFTSSVTFLILTAFYSAVVASIKSVNLYSINSFETLVNSDYGVFVEFGWNNGSTIQDIAGAVNNSPTMTQFLSKASKSTIKFQNFETMMKIVNTKPLAYVIDEETGISAIQSALGHFPCSWDRISFAGITYPWSMYMRKEMPYKKAINAGLLRMDETGLMSVLRRRWIPHFEPCPTSGGEFFAIAVNQLSTAFTICCAGLVSSVFILSIENCIKLSKSKN